MEKREIALRELERADLLVTKQIGWEEYLQQYDALDEVSKKVAGYMLATAGMSDGSGYHRYFRVDKNVEYPFMFCGWLGLNSGAGVVFRINRDGFALTENPKLFYSDDSMYFDFGAERESAESLARSIEACSSGLTDFGVELLPPMENGELRFGVTFRLSADAIKETIEMGGVKETAPLGGYLFSLPKVGEFDCIMGELLSDGAMILNYDSFCMK